MNDLLEKSRLNRIDLTSSRQVNPLRYTQPCFRVKKKSEGDYTYCTIQNCQYAHSIEDFRYLPCMYGETCRYKDTTCKFYHDGYETKKACSIRTGRPYPDLPLTSEKTYRPGMPAEDELPPTRD